MTVDISHLTGQIASPLRDNPRGAEIRAVAPGAAAESLALRFRNTHLLDLKSLEAAMEFVISPHAERHAHAEAMDIKTQQDSCRWIPTQARHYLKDPQ